MGTFALRRVFGLSACLCLLDGPSAAQQPYPSRPVEIVVPFAAGGAIDIVFRTIGPSLSNRLGQRVIIVNKSGGGATIGMYAVARAAPDGYTLGAASFAFAANPAVLDNMGYDPIKDFQPVTLVARAPMMLLVNPETPARTVDEFIAWVRSKPPGTLNYGSVGVASSGHLMTELFLARAGIKMTHVPYNGSPLPGLAQGDTHLQFSPISTSLPWMNDGRLRAVGVTSLDPEPNFPDLPPVSRTLAGFDTYEWPGLVAPAGTPRPIIDRLQREVAATVAEPEVKERFLALGFVPAGTTPEEFGAHIKKERELWAGVVRQLGPLRVTQ
ncbi:MAG TPA: tripartite tricarboxylate transporter substrate binding protein [Alphaproteobacteria bacterium]